MTSLQISPTDPSYPAALLSLIAEGEPAPPTLYLRGALPIVPGVAIVGTRAASDEALRFTRELARDLGALGFAIWSGGARGIDAAAHEGALDAGAPTVVVGGSGHACPYPKEHAPLFARVLARGGALLARVPDDTPPLPRHFIQRNAILAALTVATVVIEAGIESGARSTAAAARRLGRHLCVVPHAPWSPRGLGCALELVAGARAILRAADVIAATSMTPPPARRAKRDERGLGAARAEPRAAGKSARRGERAGDASLFLRALPAFAPVTRECADATISADERAVLDALGSGLAHVDEVCEKTGLSSYRAAEVLLTLTLQAVVVEGPAGLFRRALR